MEKTYKKPNLLKEIIQTIEERSTDLQNPLNLLSSKHCFVVAITTTGKKIKYEYTDKGYCRVDYEYLDLVPSITRSQGYLSATPTVGEATKAFCEIAIKKKYDNRAHTCQHVTRDFLVHYGLLNGSDLRSADLKKYSEIVGKKHAKKFIGFDSVHDTIIEEFDKGVKFSYKDNFKSYSKIWDFKHIFHTEAFFKIGMHKGTHKVSKAEEYKSILDEAFRSPFLNKLYSEYKKKPSETENQTK
ncbi:hypothetical protein SteCoe_5897 [Stentor coeruleus]|uniref:Uncharacterized protein n=1 Tax=Stentor coeruleus TaxID=5963 RepID=A0A1R2CRA4_9CILI|nr:hypothetical protein SteCoe_5897 [Stentor coeruleus]